MQVMAVVVSSKLITRFLSYYTNLRIFHSATISVRKYSEFESKSEAPVDPLIQDGDTSTWPDELMGPLNPRNKQFPLPGNVGISCLNTTHSNTSSYCKADDILEEKSSTERQLTIVSQLIAESDFLDENCEMSNEEYDVADTIIRAYFKEATVELAMQDCPKILYKDFTTLFLDMPKSNVTVITVTQKTQNDMTGWSQSVEIEREALLDNFITTATEICQLLKANQFWCDFIDPTSGQAYFGPYTNSALFETDDRYGNLGFQIDDLGCCKVITHKKWGSKVFVGSIVTTASKCHPVMKQLLNLVNR
ncbi:cobalamin trafficking protein CblD-like isoform X2 [Clavelina lepadiformis]|uniref:cobalamin trafficking protein CblD-like isoform X2 n=1 Tax=Clavelina lepadiformis TaxID=159417 RepID=UPI004042A84B